MPLSIILSASERPVFRAHCPVGMALEADMASRSEMYEANAAMCEHQARLLREPEAKEAYLELARTWRRMAHEYGFIARDGNGEGG